MKTGTWTRNKPSEPVIGTWLVATDLEYGRAQKIRIDVWIDGHPWVISEIEAYQITLDNDRWWYGPF